MPFWNNNIPSRLGACRRQGYSAASSCSRKEVGKIVTHTHTHTNPPLYNNGKRAYGGFSLTPSFFLKRQYDWKIKLKYSFDKARERKHQLQQQGKDKFIYFQATVDCHKRWMMLGQMFERKGGGEGGDSQLQTPRVVYNRTKALWCSNGIAKDILLVCVCACLCMGLYGEGGFSGWIGVFRWDIHQEVLSLLY